MKPQTPAPAPALGLLVALAAMIAIGAAPLPAQAPSALPKPPEIPSIVVQGLGQVRTDPDEASVRLGVVTQSESARTAQEEANRVAAAILKAAEGLGIPREDVQTSDLNLGPLYSQPEPRAEAQEPRITGYQASYVVSVRLQKLDLVGRVIDAGLAAGANQLQGVSFGLRDGRVARGAALEDAVKQAREKARTIADTLGVRLGEVLEVIEGGFAVATPAFDRRMAFEAASASAPTPIASGQVGVDATVTVRFRIDPGPPGG